MKFAHIPNFEKNYNSKNVCLWSIFIKCSKKGQQIENSIVALRNVGSKSSTNTFTKNKKSQKEEKRKLRVDRKTSRSDR